MGWSFCHVLHGLVALVVGIPEDDPQQDGQDDNGPAVVERVALQPIQEGQERFPQEVKPAEVDRPVQPQRLEIVQVFGAEIEDVGKLGRLPRAQGLHRGPDAGHHGRFRRLAQGNPGLGGLGDDGGHEVAFVQPGPLHLAGIGLGFLEPAALDVFELIIDGAVEPEEMEAVGIFPGKILAQVQVELAIQRLAGIIGHLDRQVEAVTVALERESFDQGQTLGADAGKFQGALVSGLEGKGRRRGLTEGQPRQVEGFPCHRASPAVEFPPNSGSGATHWRRPPAPGPWV